MLYLIEVVLYKPDLKKVHSEANPFWRDIARVHEPQNNGGHSLVFHRKMRLANIVHNFKGVAQNSN